MIVNPNDLLDSAAYAALLQSRQQDKANSHILGYRVSSYFPGGYLVTNERGDLTSIVEKPGAGNEPSDMVNLLVHSTLRRGVLLNYIHELRQKKTMSMNAPLMQCVKKGNQFMLYPTLAPGMPSNTPGTSLTRYVISLTAAKAAYRRQPRYRVGR